MKKIVCVLMMVVLMICTMSIFANAAEAAESVTVYVTITNEKGMIALAQEPIKVTDTDNDGAITINDALYSAHEAKYEGGAKEGYASSKTQWGISLDKLWGFANGGSYGYFLNNQSSNGLADTVKDGDYVTAYVYTDLVTWSDTFCYFDAYKISGEAGAPVTLTLTALMYDESFNLVKKPVANAVITVDGISTTYKTDEEGKVTFAIGQAGTRVISAKSDKLVLVPPVCVLTVKAPVNSQTGTQATTGAATTDTASSNGCGGSVTVAGVGIVLLAGVTAVSFGRKGKDEE